MKTVDDVVMRFIGKMRDEYDVVGAMLTGSYVTGTMQKHSDIDVFFVWRDEEQSLRGRLFFEGVEFEYFFSPEWKYYERLNSDLVAQQIYASGKIVFDSQEIFQKFQAVAQNKVQNYVSTMNVQERTDYSFHVETVMHDGLDLLEVGKRDNFLYLAGRYIPQFCDMAAKVHGKYPVYEKYAMEQLSLIDLTLAEKVKQLYSASSIENIQTEWRGFCRSILSLLGDMDISHYQSATSLKK